MVWSLQVGRPVLNQREDGENILDADGACQEAAELVNTCRGTRL